MDAITEFENNSGGCNYTQTLGFQALTFVAVTITSILSLIGAAAIIVSFLWFKELRTATSRFLLFNLSIADAIQAGTFIVGASYRLSVSVSGNATQKDKSFLCVSTAASGLYAGDSSILWTVAVMFYICLKVGFHRIPKSANFIVIMVLMLICWVVPLPVVVAYIARGLLGFKPGYSPGLCTVDGKINGSYFSAEILGFDIFLFIAFISLPLLALVTVCWVKCKVQRSGYISLPHSPSRKTELKLLFVPIAFIAIRMWSVIAAVISLSGAFGNLEEVDAACTFKAFIVFMEGIGDSSQGLVNGIFFCLLTGVVRQKIINCCCIYCHCRSCTRGCFRPQKSEETQYNIIEDDTVHSSAGDNNKSNKDLKMPITDSSAQYGSYVI